MGGSLLASENETTCDPLEAPCGLSLQVQALEQFDTYVLALTHARGTTLIAMHPNGHSLKALAVHMAAGDTVKALAQRDHVEACGGMVKPESVFLPGAWDYST